MLVLYKIALCWLVCVAVCDVWLCLCSYAGTVGSSAVGINQGMDYLEDLENCGYMDINGLVNFSDLMQGYRQ